MTSHPQSPKLATGAAVVLLAALVAFGADAHQLFSGAAASSTVKRHPRGFEIRGNLPRPLAPGVSQPLNLRLTNPYRFSLRIKKLTVAVRVDAKHAAAGCRVSRNFTLKRLATRAYPIRLGPRRTRTLRALRIRRLPRVAMRNLPTNQDACKGARLRLRYVGRAGHWRRARTR